MLNDLNLLINCLPTGKIFRISKNAILNIIAKKRPKTLINHTKVYIFEKSKVLSFSWKENQKWWCQHLLARLVMAPLFFVFFQLICVQNTSSQHICVEFEKSSDSLKLALSSHNITKMSCRITLQRFYRFLDPRLWREMVLWIHYCLLVS